MINLQRILINLIAFYVVIMSDCSSAQSISTGKSYKLSIAPNYQLTKTLTDNVELTDGKFTSGFFWTQKSTVGWNNISRVSLKLDLGKISGIGKIIFSTARGNGSEVNYPSNIFAFGSNNDQDYYYLGDIADSPENKMGTYQTSKFSLNNIQFSARFIYLMIIPNGKYLFCDEISVIRSTKSNPIKDENLTKFNALDNKINSIILESNSKKRAIEYLNKGRNPAGLNVKDRNINMLKAEDDKKRALKLRSQYKVSFLLQKLDPWATIQPEYIPNKNSKNLNYQYILPQGLTQFGAFVVTNLDDKSMEYSFKIESGGENYELFQSSYVESVNNSLVSDALVPISSHNKTKIQPGNSYLFLFKIKGKSLGKSNTVVSISNAKEKSVINVLVTTVKPLTSNTPKLNANNWAYLFYPMLSGKKEFAIRDLKSHYINTFVLPQSLLPKVNETDFSKLTEYLADIRSIDNLLIYNNFKNINNKIPNNKVPFMSQQWKIDFKTWYLKLLESLKRSNFSYNQIYLYPYDEIKGSDLKDFALFVSWVKSSIPGVKVFATIDEAKSASEILPLVDIAQVAISTQNSIKKQLEKYSNIWIYDTKGSSRNLSAYEYYRLQSWKAFFYNYEGVGFWNYADIAKDQRVNLYTSPYINGGFDYSVIYNKEDGTLLSSRRWEAFALGLEDYMLLKVYAFKFGQQKAKDLANSVLQNSNNTTLADSVRDQIIDAIN